MVLKIEKYLWAGLDQGFRWLADDSHGADDAHADDGGGHGSFGVHISYPDLYHSIIWLTAIYVMGVIFSRVFRMPNLVGEICAGILLGPNLADFVPNAEAWVLLGEIGLILLVIEAGIDIDTDTLKLIGARGFMIAIIGSVLPIGIGIGLAFAMGLDVNGAIAAGASFGPTSLGIALNILRGGGVLNTPVGQLIISAAVIDDMIALIVLSQLETLTKDSISAADVVIPIVSAFAYLIFGGFLAVFVAPIYLDKWILSKVKKEHRDKVELAILIAILLGLMPATYYCKASPLMGAFLAGLVFCRSHSLHSIFVRQLKRILQWLMRIFFAASIGFQVPIKKFGHGEVIWQGLVYTIALLGKLAVGFMVPNFSQDRRFRGNHFRDCLITGFSMAAEGEFAFVIAVFAVDSGLISVQVYASIVFAVLLSTIVPPFLLRFTISHYNKKAEAEIQAAAEQEQLADDSKTDYKRQVFMCIQTQSESGWGLMHTIMNCMKQLGLDVIDHRSWHPRGLNTTCVNEIYCRDAVFALKDVPKEEEQAQVAERIEEIRAGLVKAIDQEDAKVRVQRWRPGVVEELVEEVEERTKVSVENRLLSEATAALEKKRDLQLTATKAHTVEDLLGSDAELTGSGLPEVHEGVALEGGALPSVPGATTTPSRPQGRRRKFSKTRSTPVVGGGLFEDTATGSQPTSLELQEAERKRQQAAAAAAASRPAADLESQVAPASAPPVERRRARRKMLSVPVGRGGLFGGDTSDDDAKASLDSFRREAKARDSFFTTRVGPSGVPAELTVEGETFRIRIPEETLKNLRKGYSGGMLDNRSISMSGVTMATEDAPVVNMLQGYVRSSQRLGKIQEESHSEAVSEVSENESQDLNNGDKDL